VGVGLHDATPRALSAAFFFHDPDYAHLSLGTANVISLIEDARTGADGDHTGAPRPYVYLGYRVAGCPSLQYKGNFRPHELLRDRPEPNQDPAPWKEVEP
jgi:arginine-tRNA-protein transferase